MLELPEGAPTPRSVAAHLARRQRLLRVVPYFEPITYPELRAEQIRAGDLERIAYERERDREWERMVRRAS